MPHRGLLLRIPILLALALLGREASGQEPDYLTAIRTVEDFDLVSVPSTSGGERERVTKYLLPASDEPTLLGPVFQNVAKYDLHFDFLKSVFPDRFPELEDMEDYLALMETRATRKYFAGVLTRFRNDQGTFYGFNVYTADPVQDPTQLLTVEEVRGIHQDLSSVFDLRPLAYAPARPAEVEVAAGWTNPGFPVYLGAITQSAFEAYTRAVGYGRVRLLTAGEFADANDRGLLTWQDVVVLERAPSDIEGVVAGVITAEPQGELSHVAIRTARRGTPNAFVRDALQAFAALDGKLVRLEVTATGYTASDATTAEAEAWWSTHRPHLSTEPTLDPEYAGLDSLEEMDLSGVPVPPEARFGGKASNLAKLQRLWTGDLAKYRERGFAIPVRYYLEFLRQNRTRSPIDPRRRVTYEEYLVELQGMDAFKSDSEARYRALEAFRDEMEDDGVVDPSLLGAIVARVEEVFGSAQVMVRFRSSSNVEDSLEFNGAGLYESSSGCAADQVDEDNLGPSRCDPNQPRERLVEEAIKEVWASLWTFRANEERSWYGIPSEKVAMGILVTQTFLAEKANGVAFTGNPGNALDRRYMVTAQVGEESVVSPDPGKIPEKDHLEVADGVVTMIERARRSSLVPPGGEVLSDALLRELGAALWHVDKNFPLDLGTHAREEVLLDVEFKVEGGDVLSIKQVRPFLLAAPPVAGPTFEIEIPQGTTVCGVFADGREPRPEYEVKSQLRFKGGKHSLPTGAPSFAAAIVEEIVFGPGREKATSLVPGRFRWSVRVGTSGEATYSFQYDESFSLQSGETLDLEMEMYFSTKPGEPPPSTVVFDEEFLARGLNLRAVPGGDSRRNVRYGSCSYSTIPLWQVRGGIEGGDVVELDERYQELDAGSGPANLVGATVTIVGERREVRDYWKLVYAAQHHNVDRQYWVVLDPPIPYPGGKEIHVVEYAEPNEESGKPPRAAYLDASYAVVARPTVVCHERGEPGQLRGCFRRGDADSTGKVNLTDAIFALTYLFRGGDPPACLDAADFNDDGIVEITDPILVLTFLFQGVDLSTPPGPFECGNDPTKDGLAPCDDAGCR